MIKLIDILKEINEGKQVGTLYHFTLLKNLFKFIHDFFKKSFAELKSNTSLLSSK